VVETGDGSADKGSAPAPWMVISGVVGIASLIVAIVAYLSPRTPPNPSTHSVRIDANSSISVGDVSLKLLDVDANEASIQLTSPWADCEVAIVLGGRSAGIGYGGRLWLITFQSGLKDEWLEAAVQTSRTDDGTDDPTCGLV